MTTILVQINDQTLPLVDCAWVEYRPCGCPCSVMNADWGDGIAFATDEQAWRELYPTKRERERAIKQGFTLELVTFKHYREHINLTASCAACKPGKTA